jgi:hypothetical protein
MERLRYSLTLAHRPTKVSTANPVRRLICIS